MAIPVQQPYAVIRTVGAAAVPPVPQPRFGGKDCLFAWWGARWWFLDFMENMCFILSKKRMALQRLRLSSAKNLFERMCFAVVYLLVHIYWFILMGPAPPTQGQES